MEGKCISFKSAQAEYIIEYCFRQIQSSKFANTHERSLSLGHTLMLASALDNNEKWIDESKNKNVNKASLFKYLCDNSRKDFLTRSSLVRWFGTYDHKSQDREIILKHERQYILENLYKCQQRRVSRTPFPEEQLLQTSDEGNIFKILSGLMMTPQSEIKDATYKYHQNCPDVNLRPICGVTSDRWNTYILENEKELVPFILDAVCNLFKVTIKIFCIVSKELIIFYPNEETEREIAIGHRGGKKYVPLRELQKGLDIKKFEEKQAAYLQINEKLSKLEVELEETKRNVKSNEIEIKHLEKAIESLKRRREEIENEIEEKSKQYEREQVKVQKIRKKVQVLNEKTVKMEAFLAQAADVAKDIKSELGDLELSDEEPTEVKRVAEELNTDLGGMELNDEKPSEDKKEDEKKTTLIQCQSAVGSKKMRSKRFTTSRDCRKTTMSTSHK